IRLRTAQIHAAGLIVEVPQYVKEAAASRPARAALPGGVDRGAIGGTEALGASQRFHRRAPTGPYVPFQPDSARGGVFAENNRVVIGRTTDGRDSVLCVAHRASDVWAQVPAEPSKPAAKHGRRTSTKPAAQAFAALLAVQNPIGNHVVPLPA